MSCPRKAFSAEETRIVERRKTGERPTDIAKDMGATDLRVRAVLERALRAGVVFPRCVQPKQEINLSPLQERIIKLRNKRWRTERIADELHCTDGQVNRAIRKAKDMGIEVHAPERKRQELIEYKFCVRGKGWFGYPRAVYSKEQQDALKQWRVGGGGEIEKVERIEVV